MTKRQLLECIEALERRVAELEARPSPAPWDVTPKWAPPQRLTYPLPDDWVERIRRNIETAQAAYDHDGLRSSGTV